MHEHGDAVTHDTTVVAIVLAAGRGSRFDAPDHKLTATLGGESVAGRAIGAALAAAIGPVVVVTGAIDAVPPRWRPRVTVVENPRWADGQATSLACGLAEAERLGAAAVVVGLADQPLVQPEAWRRVAASVSPIAIATYDGRRGNPVRLDRSVWTLLPTTGDEGARALARLQPQLVEQVPCPGSPLDIDTVADLKTLEDLLTWQSESSTNSP